jgi:hypothetical protein
MTNTITCFCFFERKPNLLRIDRSKEIIREFEATGQLVADYYSFKDEGDLINVLFKNPDKHFVRTLKQTLDIDLTACYEK